MSRLLLKKRVAENLKKFRIMQGYDHAAAFARACGLNTRSYQRHEDEGSPSIDTIFAIVEIYGVEALVEIFSEVQEARTDDLNPHTVFAQIRVLVDRAEGMIANNSHEGEDGPTGADSGSEPST